MSCRFVELWRPDGRLDQIQRPNDVTSTYSYDGGGRLSGIEHVGPSGPVESFVYDHDSSGNRTSVSSGLDDAEYTYDELDRLIDVDATSGNESFTYDGSGNILTHTTSAGTTSFTYDAAGQRVQAVGPDGTIEYTYDADGNLVSSSDGSAYSWDSAGMLTSATVEGNTTDYGYDGLGRRVRLDGAPQLWDPATDTLVSDGTQSFTHSPVGLIAASDGTDATYPLADGLGSTRLSTDADGTTIGTTNYTAYGEPTQSTGTVGAFGYTGQQTDPNGLIHLRARAYDPRMASFMSPDTLQPNAGGTQGWNPYSYALSSPIDNADPTGHQATATPPKVGPVPIQTAAGASALTSVSTRTSSFVYDGVLYTSEGATRLSGSSGSASSTISVGQKQQARPGGGSSLVAYGAITSAAVIGSWFFTRIGTYNSVTFAVSVRLLETPPSPDAQERLQERMNRSEHLLQAQRLRPGKCGVNPDDLANRAAALQGAQDAMASRPSGRFQTTAVLRSHFIVHPWLCFDFVGSGKDLQFGDDAPGVYALLEPQEAPVYLGGEHAEIVVLAWSSALSMLPIALGVSSYACATPWSRNPLPEGYRCKDVLRASGARPWGGNAWSSRSWYWPGSMPYIVGSGWF